MDTQKKRGNWCENGIKNYSRLSQHPPPLYQEPNGTLLGQRAYLKVIIKLLPFLHSKLVLWTIAYHILAMNIFIFF